MPLDGANSGRLMALTAHLDALVDGRLDDSPGHCRPCLPGHPHSDVTARLDKTGSQESGDAGVALASADTKCSFIILVQFKLLLDLDITICVEKKYLHKRPCKILAS